jgi:O-antigen ligase
MSFRGDIPGLQSTTRIISPWLVALIGFSVPLSVALDNVLLALVLLAALANLGSISRIIATHLVARAAMLLFAILIIAMGYGETPIGQAFALIGKYVDLMFIPIFIFFLSDEESRRRARLAFLAAMAFTLVLSCLVRFELMPVMSWMVENVTQPANPVIFHSHITQNNMMAFAAFLALLEARGAGTVAVRIGWGLFAFLAASNVLFMVQGRTGYLVLMVLLGWFAWSSLARHMQVQGKAWGWKQGLAVTGALVMLALAAYHLSERLHDRVGQVISEYQAWTPGHGKLTSTGQRLDFYSNALQIVRDHPVAGVGSGGFTEAFKRQVQGSEVLLTNNPHNEYLLIAVQTGLVGLALLLYLFYTQWRFAPWLSASLEQDAARGLVLAYMVNCMLNSALHDHADGLFFAFMTATLFAGLKREVSHG